VIIIDKMIVAVVAVTIVIVAVVGVASFLLAPEETQTSKTPTVIQSGVATTPQAENPVISGQEAKLIVIGNITEPGAYPGNPTLYKMPDGQLIWKIPIISNHVQVGTLYVDATTGKTIS
jgi:hypothetical protein